ncbi:rhombosortase [Alcanivorax quisquiliarum]|uniref:Rhombosortase n=1 Tax=Alcanivorax quisquiliarum TaxID=2933565 RepID=A0ABT0E8P5_9GAMM|nr:rhombosortase [Alcanivorax quisquiliarum]MCK0538208.1 rhombosortase [Alcanivorax quisquiliarum]
MSSASVSTLRDPLLRRHLLVFSLLLVVLGLAHGWVNPLLEYQRIAIVDGQLWRLYSAHFVHLNHWHLLMNLGGFLLCAWFFPDIYSRRLLWLWLLVSPLVVSLLMLYVDQANGPYVGLSGILHGWLVLALLLGFRTHPWLHGLVLALVAGRLIGEQLPGYDAEYLRYWIDGRVYVNAHLYGALTGVLLAAGVALVHRRRRSFMENSAARL